MEKRDLPTMLFNFVFIYLFYGKKVINCKFFFIY